MTARSSMNSLASACLEIHEAELLRFNTSKSGEEQISFEEYVDRMREGQNDIYCITGESIAAVSSLSFREFRRRTTAGEDGSGKRRRTRGDG